RAVAIVRHGVHAVADERKVGGDREGRSHLRLRKGLDALAVAITKLDHETWLPQDAVVRDGRRVVRHLKRRREQIALSDREVRRVPRIPYLVGGVGEVRLLPIRAWHYPFRLVDEVDVRGLA